MDKKIAAIIAAVAVVVIAATAVMMLGGNDDDSEKEYETGNSIPVNFSFNNEIRLAIFGNVNGDDYLDQKDVDLLKDILDGKVAYDSKKHCFADTNADEKLDAEDVKILQALVNKESGNKMYYYDAASNIASINYPLHGKIATYHVYPLDACIILGLYDDVVGMSNQGFTNSVGRDPYRYPGIGTKIVNIGTPHEDCQALLASNANVYLLPWSYDNSTIQKIINASHLDLQIVQLPMSKNGPNIVDQYGALMMLGVMTQTEDKAYEYMEFVDKIQDNINSAVSKISGRYTFLTPMIGSSKTEVSLDSPYTSGSMPGDVYTIAKLPMDSVNLVVDSGCPTVSIEWVIDTNPNVIVVIMFDDYKSSVEDIKKKFNESIDVYKNTEAYKNGMIFGVNYYNIANYAGIPTLPLVASYIWPDLFNEESSMQVLQEYYEKYTAYENPVVSQMGNAIAYKMETLSA